MHELDAKARRVYELIEQEMLNPADGMPGDVNHSIGRRIAGYYMLTFCYLPFARPLPNAEAAIDLIIRAQMRSGEIGEGGMCQNWDAMHVLNHVCRQTRWQCRMAEVAALADRLARFLVDTHHKPDGGFSFHPDVCQQEHNMIRVSPARPESDMQGTQMTLACLNIAASLQRNRYRRSYLDQAIGSQTLT